MKVIFELVASDTNVAIELQKQRDLVRQLNKEYKASTAPEEQQRLIGELAKAKVAISDLTKQQRALNNEFKSTQVPSDSLAGLRLEYSRLTAEITNLTKAERESDLGKAVIGKAGKLKDEIKDIEASIGNFTGNVGNYRDALLSVGDLVTGGLITGGAIAAVEKLAEVMSVGVEAAIEYEKALDDLSALTGKTGDQLAEIQGVADGLKTINVNGVEIVNTGADILNALKLVGGAKPDLLENAAALGEVTKQAIILSQASGDSLESSVVALTTVLGQFNLAGSESGRVINELAAGAKVGASEIPDTTDALQKFGTVAATVNVKTSESIALIELLAERQLKGAEAGTQLRSILAKIASADILPKAAQKEFERLGINIGILKDSALPLEIRLRELGKAQGDVSALTKIFGLENLQAATIITDGIPKYVSLTQQVTNTTEALTQAAIRSDNAATSFQNLKNKSLNELQEGFQGLTPTLKAISDALGGAFDKVDIFGTALKGIVPNISLFNGFLGQYQKLSNKTAKETATAKESIDAIFGNPEGGDQLKPFLDARTAQLIELKKAAGLAVDGVDKVRGKKEDVPPAAGSIEFLRDRVKKLKDELESAKPDQIPKLLGNLIEAEKQLKALEDQVEILRNKAAGRAKVDPLNTLPSPEIAKDVQQETNDARLKEIKKFNDEVSKDDAKRREREKIDELKAEKEKEEAKKLIRGAAADALISAVGAIADSENKKIEEQKNSRLAAVDEEYQKRKEAAAGNAVQLAKIDKEYEAKKAQIEKDAARERQRVAIIESLIAGALAVVKALPNVPLAIATGIAAATQTAIIATKKFAVGGFTGKGTRTDETGERMVNAQLHEDEYVAPRAQVQQYPHLFKWLDRNRPKRGASTGIGFATGGFSTAPAVTFSTAQSRAEQAISLSATAEISQTSAQVLADTIAKQVFIAMAAGLNDADRTNERKQKLEEFTNV